jgi:putative FmdB family regulatory protein
MPLYEYVCHRCGKTFEVIQKFADEPLALHQECGGAEERLLSAPALQFKGSGWYVTDYGQGNKPASDSTNGNGSKPGKPETKPKPETKSESKPAPAASAEK